MDVKHGLARVPAVVDNHPVTVLLKPQLRRNGLCHKKEMADKLPVSGGNAVDVSNMFLRYDKDMRRRLRIKILECESKFILMDDLRRNLLVDDLAEYAVRIEIHRVPPPVVEKLLKKQERAPVWHAGPVCSTLMRSVS